MSSLELANYEVKVVSTYPTAVTCTVWYKNATGGPTPGPALPIQPNSIQVVGNGEVASIEVSYTDATGPHTVMIPYGSPNSGSRTLNALWATGPTTQVIVIVETSLVDPGPK